MGTYDPDSRKLWPVNVYLFKETEAAVLVGLEPREKDGIENVVQVWLPRSQLVEERIVRKPVERTVTLHCKAPQWLLYSKLQSASRTGLYTLEDFDYVRN